MNVILAALSATAMALAAVLFGRIRIARRKIHAEKFRVITADRQAAQLKKQIAQLQADQKFLVRFLKDFPHVAHELHEAKGGRRIPELLLNLVVRILEPARALVIVRRRVVDGDGNRVQRLVVAAAAPEGGPVALGTEISLGQGPIGFGAEVQRVMDRRDFDSQPPDARAALQGQTLPGFTPDIVAPLVSSEETLGVIAVQGLKRGTVDPKDVLRVIAQTGALAVRNLERLTEVKATASLDGMTGVFNKRFITLRLAEHVHQALDEHENLAVFLFDIDHFKHYNDRNGHVAGDQVLRKLAQLVQANVRQDSLFGRFGGEEFILVLPGADKAQGLAAAENVRKLIAEHAFEFGADQPLERVSISGGVAACPEDASESGVILRSADEALYAAKHAGRNRVLGYVPQYLGGEAQEPVAPADFHVPAEPEAPTLLPGEAAAARRLEVDGSRADETGPLNGSDLVALE